MYIYTKYIPTSKRYTCMYFYTYIYIYTCFVFIAPGVVGSWEKTKPLNFFQDEVAEGSCFFEGHNQHG